ncbi:MAG: hypothetical protein IT484_07495 [Gammaproteobacteria bacterium]|nr:hypothetical protein [Gammaproteobacteria bacterium]
MPADLIAILLGVVVINSCVLPASLVPPSAAMEPGMALPRVALLMPLVVAAASGLGWLLLHHLLAPLRLGDLQPLASVILAALFAQLAARLHDRMVGQRRSVPRALLTFNAAAASLALGATLAPASPAAATLAGAWTGAALGVLNLCFAALGARLDGHALPAAWRGTGIRLVSAAILSLGLGGFAGIWRG